MKNYFLAAGLALTMGVGMQAQELPAELYFVGNINNWVTPDEADETQLMVLSPTSEGIYECAFDYNFYDFYGAIQFKLFSAKSNWDEPESYWGGPDETKYYTPGTDIVWNEMLQGWDGYNFVVETYYGSQVHITVDWNDKTVTLSDNVEAVVPEELHLVGEFNGWEVTNHDYQLSLSTADLESTHFTGTFTLPVGPFKIVGGDSWDINFGTNAPYNLWGDKSTTLPLVANGDNFTCMNWKEGEMTMDVDWDNKTVTLLTPDQPEYVLPESLHLVGVFNNWDVANHDYVLEMNTEVNHVEYVGTFDIPEGECEFKILSGDSWDDSFGTSYGSGFTLWKWEPISFRLTSGNSNNFNCTNWEGGRLQVVVNWSDYTVRIDGLDQPEYVKEDVIYLIGAPQGWDITSDAMKLKRVDNGGEKSAVYAGSFNIAAGDAMFRFYTELGYWDYNSLGSQYDDEPTDIYFNSDASFSGDMVWGKGSWNIPDWEGGIIDMTVDLMSMQVTFSTENSGVETLVAGDNSLRYANGIVTVAKTSPIVVADAAGRIVMKVSGNSADLSGLPGGLYIVKAGDNVMKIMK